MRDSWRNHRWPELLWCHIFFHHGRAPRQRLCHQCWHSERGLAVVWKMEFWIARTWWRLLQRNAARLKLMMNVCTDALQNDMLRFGKMQKKLTIRLRVQKRNLWLMAASGFVENWQGIVPHEAIPWSAYYIYITLSELYFLRAPRYF